MQGKLMVDETNKVTGNWKLETGLVVLVMKLLLIIHHGGMETDIQHMIIPTDTSTRDAIVSKSGHFLGFRHVARFEVDQF